MLYKIVATRTSKSYSGKLMSDEQYALNVQEDNSFFDSQKETYSWIINDQEFQNAFEAARDYYDSLEDEAEGSLRFDRNTKAVKYLVYLLANTRYKEDHQIIRQHAISLLFINAPKSISDDFLVSDGMGMTPAEQLKAVYQTIESVSKIRGINDKESSVIDNIVYSCGSLPIMLMLFARTIASFSVSFNNASEKEQKKLLLTARAMSTISINLGFELLKNQFDELLLTHGNPELREKILVEIEQDYGRPFSQLEGVRAQKHTQLDKLLKSQNIKAITESRVKNPSSYYKKKKTRYKDTPMKHIPDVVAFRITAEDGQVKFDSFKQIALPYGVKSRAIYDILYKNQYIESSGKLTEKYFLAYIKKEKLVVDELVQSFRRKITNVIQNSMHIKKGIPKSKTRVIKELFSESNLRSAKIGRLSPNIVKLIVQDLESQGFFGASVKHVMNKLDNLSLPIAEKVLLDSIMSSLRQIQIENLVKVQKLFEQPTGNVEDILLHSQFNEIFGVPLPPKDFVNYPKKNGYQALHFNFECKQGSCEVQLVTGLMYHNNAFGTAAHGNYKAKSTLEKKLTSEIRSATEDLHPVCAKYQGIYENSEARLKKTKR
jgi:ppGpp synthetase/RelA/SpoT-type nucleotidyltranferase